jgi:hypothetical protein
MELLESHAHEVECGLVVSGPSNPPSQDLPLVVEELDPNQDEFEQEYMLHHAYWEGYGVGYAADLTIVHKCNINVATFGQIGPV